ncbi:virulence factor TspB C-terminal domain-related protein [Luteimonas sp. RC10]|uniref:virulence factor TspB C-terminal domain-related protein n=1 Tax=Luteimonas sp. RC10 TaxID=2587035 RepID=UPI001622C7C1|nr:virulence factor TspB C-terminal domain-related protein [Luteimonas sp. RC10]MBB3344514.1 hypothetical protein [Luteimonas sp. RC10]
MRRNARLLHRVQRLSAFALGLFVVAFAGIVTAQSEGEYIPRGNPIPHDVRVVGTNATGADTRAAFRTTFPNGSTMSHNLPVRVSATTIGRLAAGAVKRGLGIYGTALLLKDLFNGAGWAIDELKGQVTQGGEPQEDLGAQGWCRYQKCASSPSGLIPAAQAEYFANNGPNPDIVSWRVDLPIGSDYGAICAVHRLGGCAFVWPFELVTQPHNGWDDYENVNPGSAPVVVSDVQLANAILTSPHAQQITNSLLTDPQTGAPVRTPELVEATNNLRRTLEQAGHLAPGGSDVVVGGDYGQTPTPYESDLPQYCTWAKVVCDFIAWFKADPSLPDNPEVPHEEREITWQTYDSGHGNGSCPAPITVNLGWMGSFEITYQPICDFVIYMRPLLKGLAWMAAAFIVVNATRRS